MTDPFDPEHYDTEVSHAEAEAEAVPDLGHDGLFSLLERATDWRFVDKSQRDAQPIHVPMVPTVNGHQWPFTLHALSRVEVSYGYEVSESGVHPQAAVVRVCVPVDDVAFGWQEGGTEYVSALGGIPILTPVGDGNYIPRAGWTPLHHDNEGHALPDEHGIIWLLVWVQARSVAFDYASDDRTWDDNTEALRLAMSEVLTSPAVAEAIHRASDAAHPEFRLSAITQALCTSVNADPGVRAALGQP